MAVWWKFYEWGKLVRKVRVPSTKVEFTEEQLRAICELAREVDPDGIVHVYSDVYYLCKEALNRVR